MPHRLRRARRRRPGGRAPHRRDLPRRAWRVSLEATDPDSSWPFMVTVHTSQPVLACLGSQYAGWSLRSTTRARNTTCSAQARRARSAPRRSCSTSSAIATTPTSAALVLEADRAPPPGSGRAGRQGLQAFARAAHLHLRADVEPRRHGADRRALPRSRAAQGARAAFPARPYRRRHRHRAVAAAGARFRRRHGPHQRRHHLWRARAALRLRSAQGGEGARRQAAEPEVEGLRQAVRRDLRGGEGRLLRHRPHVVQPGQGDGDRARNRRELRGRAISTPRCCPAPSA